MSDESFSYFACERIGLAGTTPVTIKHHADGTREARMGFALFGSTNMDEEGFRRAQYNPFHNEFHDNYAIGKGATQEEAITALRKELDSIHEGLWA